MLGPDRRLDRLAGSRALGIGLGCPLGLGGSSFSWWLGGCGVTSRLGYPARDTKAGGGGEHRADPGTQCVASGPRGSWSVGALHRPCWEPIHVHGSRSAQVDMGL